MSLLPNLIEWDLKDDISELAAWDITNAWVSQAELNGNKGKASPSSTKVNEIPKVSESSFADIAIVLTLNLPRQVKLPSSERQDDCKAIHLAQ